MSGSGRRRSLGRSAEGSPSRHREVEAERGADPWRAAHAERGELGLDAPRFRAPGRVNVIGDHTDYQDGLCLPMAIDRDVVVGVRSRADGRVVVQSSALPGVVDVAADGRDDPRSVMPAWGRTVAAVLAVLADAGRAPAAFDAVVTSDLPVGSGLASSAAFGVAFALAAAAAGDLVIAGRDLALAAQDAEHRASGVPCGVMDQMAIVYGRRGHALVLDCRTLTVDALALPAEVEVLVLHSGVARRLEDSAYARRRAACEAAAERVGVSTLRDATHEQVADDPIARHVVTENERVQAFAAALTRGAWPECGRIMLASHASLAHDFRVSTPELDTLVAAATDAGAFGARLTGAGFGGCVVALVAAGTTNEVAEAVASRYRAATGLTATAFAVRAASGAGPVGSGGPDDGEH